jgi:hypothetical protein
MAKNIVRFVTWQNPLTVPLVLLSVRTDPEVLRNHAKPVPRSHPQHERDAYPVALPGRRLGYRYLHGFLGSACLLAAWSLSRLWEGLDALSRRKAAANLFMVSAAALFVLLPVRLWHAREFVQPYVSASRFIRAMPADVVLVDDTKVWQGVRLIRNNPLVTNRPVTMHYTDLTRVQIRDLCAHHSVAFFSPSDAAHFGLWADLPSRSAQAAKEAADREPAGARLSRRAGIACDAQAGSQQNC